MGKDLGNTFDKAAGKLPDRWQRPAYPSDNGGTWQGPYVPTGKEHDMPFGKPK